MKPIITIICLVGSLGILFFAAWPEYQELRESMAYADVKEEDLQNMINYNQTLESIVSRIENDYEDQFNKVKESIPDDHYMPSFFAELRRISYRTGVRVESLGNFSVGQGDREINEIETSLNVQGDYSNFKSFIKALERSGRIIEVESVSIEGASTDPDERSILRYNVQILTYSY